MLERFSFKRFIFTLKPEEELSLPEFKGTTLRGGFGSQFKRIVCLKKDQPECSACPLKKVCVYSYIFETSPSESSEKLRKIRNIPRPFVIEPPDDTKRIYTSIDTLTFNLTLIGKAVDYLPYFIFTFRELGEKGLGKGRKKYWLDRIETPSDHSDFSLKTIYNGKDDTLIDFGEPQTLDSLLKTRNWNNINKITFAFLTPTRIRLDNKFVIDPEFQHIIRALLHRISALSYFHCGEELKVDFRSLIKKSEEIEKVHSDVQWKDIERYSMRQNTRMKMGGFVGEATYKGKIEEFLPLIFLGEQIHIGKSCTFGLGKFRIDEHK